MNGGCVGVGVSMLGLLGVGWVLSGSSMRRGTVVKQHAAPLRRGLDINNKSAIDGIAMA
jgi:hypothetical protein